MNKISLDVVHLFNYEVFLLYSIKYYVILKKHFFFLYYIYNV